jgi:acetyltransferase
MLVRFTQIDYDREMAFIAVAGTAEQELEVGVARYVVQPDAQSCEFALVVADAYHGKGVGSALMQVLIETARAKGIDVMIGEVLTENRNMLELVQNLGFQVSPHPGDATLRVVRLDL